MRLLAAIAAAGIMGLSLLFAPGDNKSSASNGPATFWVKVVFGVDGKSAAWDGQATIRGGEILQISEWQSEERDTLEPATRSWKIETGIAPPRKASFAEPERGVLLKVSAGAETVLSISTRQGNVDIKPLELTPGRPIAVLGGRATVEPLGTESLVAETKTDDDFPTIAVAPNGHRHVAWIAYDDEAKTDRLLIRNIDDPASVPEPIALATEFATPQILFDAKGTLRAFWCSPGDDANWDIYTAERKATGWQSERITKAKGTDFELSVSKNAAGVIWLAWQSFRDGNADIFAKCLRDSRWSSDIQVTDHPTNDWQPSVSVDQAGRAWIGYDSYQNGNYDVYVRQLTFDGRESTVGRQLPVATTEDFEAHASVLADGENVWVAYDAAGPNWGKDFRNVPTMDGGEYSEPLHASRRLELRLVKNDGVYQPTTPLPQLLPPDPIAAIERVPTAKPSRFYEFPQLARDGNGRVWIFFRQCRQGYSPHPPKGACWRIYATTFAEKGWLEPIELPESWGRQDQRISTAIGTDGTLQCTWADGNRFASVNRKYSIHVGALPAIAERPAEIAWDKSPLETPQPSANSPLVEETKQSDGLQALFGDLHRHTNISRCSPTVDGCLNDAHRYALDAVEHDFLAITDHTRDVDPFSWWRTQKASDLFHIPDKYVPIYAYERSNTALGGGHRNVFLLHRGAEVNRSEHWYLGRNLPVENRDPDTTLYPWLSERGDALTAAHTPEYNKDADRGTWTFNDPQVEPVTEIFQGFRQSYERPGKGVSEGAALWSALRKGFRLGFIASSDHISTHMSYACVWAKAKSREEIFKALRARHTYAATDRIILNTHIGSAMMGDEIDHTASTVQLTITGRGTAPVKEIEVVRSGEVIALLKPESQQLDLTYVDEQPLSGTSYYYVRLVQDDGGIAWGSPIWVNR